MPKFSPKPGDLAMISPNMSGRLVSGYVFCKSRILTHEPPERRVWLTGDLLDSEIASLPADATQWMIDVRTHSHWAVWSVAHRFSLGDLVIVMHEPTRVSNSSVRSALGMKPLSTLTEVLLPSLGRRVWVKSGSLRAPK